MKKLIYKSILPGIALLLLLLYAFGVFAQSVEEVPTLSHLLFGTDNIKFIVAGFVYLNIGIFASSVINTTGREPHSDRTPFRFSWKFFCKDNWKRWAKSVMFGLIAMRFSQELFNQTMTVYLAFMIGAGIDGIIIIIQKKKII